MDSTWFTVLTVFYVIVCVFLIFVVLLQSGKSGGMGAMMGGSSQSVFGGAGAGNFLTRLTAISAMLFMLLSGTLAYLSSDNDKALGEAASAVKSKAVKAKPVQMSAPTTSSKKAATPAPDANKKPANP